MTDKVATYALYARVSTAGQDSKGQLERLESYSKSIGCAAPLVFKDDGVSGVRDNRPELDRLREAMRKGEVSTVIVTKVDRLGRSLGMILRFWDEADAAHVRVIVTDQGIDTSTPAGRFQRNMLAACAEFERELILERTREGIAEARRLGKRFGRPPKITDAQRAECLKRLSNGESSRDVSQAMHIPAGTVRWIWGKARLETPPVVSEGGQPRGT